VLIARAPLRISLAGGGTDLEAYYSRHGGAVVSTTIDKHFYVIVSPSDGAHIQVSSSDYRTFFRRRVDEPAHFDGDLKLPKAVIHYFGIRSGLSVFLASQVPPGTGLGSSSAVAVALVKAMSVLCGQRLTVHETAELACEIEIERLGMPIGKQDQYAASFGGLNCYEFTDQGVSVERLHLTGETLASLEKRLLLFLTPIWHDSSNILDEQRRNSGSSGGHVVEALHVIKAIACQMRAELLRGDISKVGVHLHKSWLAKRQLARGVTDHRIDSWYEAALAAGASGGKIAGAGGGGFLLLHCEPEHQERVTETLAARGLHRMDFRFESGGAMVIVNHMADKLVVAGGDMKSADRAAVRVTDRRTSVKTV
jgi:D-glycero-alpha-D-manno-heptose-7-phosphate kinase